ncbi:hypothetical protein CEXT_512271 [Caerostris extrusa]|uniref:Uncharacterized protein n=1 Tax=Caerostris extrusa TaxID=172846 RepID=A0AAV4M9T8_CAEEX|nr:hypothetical protein CEXT_512271 [Caerostris extrusa]
MLYFTNIVLRAPVSSSTHKQQIRLSSHEFMMSLRNLEEHHHSALDLQCSKMFIIIRAATMIKDQSAHRLLNFRHFVLLPKQSHLDAVLNEGIDVQGRS